MARIKGDKISHEQFFSILRENAGLYSRTARAISQQFNIKYSRQAARDRAEKHPKILNDIAEEGLDIAEEGLQALIRSKNENIKLRAIELILKTKGKKRGYVEHTVITGENDGIIKVFVSSSDKELIDKIK